MPKLRTAHAGPPHPWGMPESVWVYEDLTPLQRFFGRKPKARKVTGKYVWRGEDPVTEDALLALSDFHYGITRVRKPGREIADEHSLVGTGMRLAWTTMTDMLKKSGVTTQRIRL